MNSSLQQADYSNLFNSDSIASTVNSEGVCVRNPYGNALGVQYEFGNSISGGKSEILQLDDNAALIFCDLAEQNSIALEHIVGHDDWIHIQFRLSGTGSEEFSESQVIQTPGQSYVITRHQANTSSIRTTDKNKRSRFACLYFRPIAVQNLFMLSPNDFPKDTQWVGAAAQSEFDWLMKAIPSPISIAANDIFSCDLKGNSRNTYMRAKAMELMALTVNDLQRNTLSDSSIRLSSRDLECLSEARNILITELHLQHSLQGLAHRCGINRTKLAVGFKSVYGETVAAYWRDLKLSKARQLLEEEGVTVIEAANAVGYAESSCLSRAFMTRYGIQPIECRNKGRKN